MRKKKDIWSQGKKNQSNVGNQKKLKISDSTRKEESEESIKTLDITAYMEKKNKSVIQNLASTNQAIDRIICWV